MSANEVYLGFVLIQSLLAPDTTLQGYAPGGVYRAMAPPETVAPYVTHALQSPGQDTMTAFKYRIMSNPLYQIKATGPAALTSQLANAEQQIDILLGGKSGLKNQVVTGGIILACFRESAFQIDDPVLINGELYSSFGGLWRMQIVTT